MITTLTMTTIVIKMITCKLLIRQSQSIIETKNQEFERKRNLNEILQHVDGDSGSDDEDDDDEDEIMTEAERDGDQEQGSKAIVEGLCIDCQDQVKFFFFFFTNL